MSSFQGHMAGWHYPASSDQAETVQSAEGDQSGEQACDQAISALVAQYAQPLYRVAFSVLRNAAEAEDAVQETFLRVLKNRKKLPEVRDARVWLVRITWNVVMDRKRRSKVRPETDDVADLERTLACSAPGGEAYTISGAEYLRILGLIDKLPGKERQALLLSAVEELTTSEIAEVLAVSESSVRSRLFRARQQLGKLLEDGPARLDSARADAAGGKR